MKRRTLLAGLIVAPALLRQPASAATVPVAVIRDGLDHPWSLAFLPDGSLLITERRGRLWRLALDGSHMEEIMGPPTVAARQQGGLLDVALDPAFESNRRLYFSFSERQGVGSHLSVARAEWKDGQAALAHVTTIFRANASHSRGMHFGSRVVPDRDGYLYVTSGDRYSLREKAQDPASHAGKILRLTPDGKPVPGNTTPPEWAPEVFSIGHRNPQGAALHPDTGELWTAEHAAMGGDEINIIRRGRNYGWPVITYGRDYDGSQIGEGTAKVGMEQPVHYWDPSIAPAGMCFYTASRFETWRNCLFVCALKGQHIAMLSLDGPRVVSEQRLAEGFARFRDVAQGPDGHLYAITDAPQPQGAVVRLG